MLLKWLAIMGVLGSLMSHNGATAGSYSTSGDERYIVLASRQGLDDAIGVAQSYAWRFPGVRVMRSSNGWYAVKAKDAAEFMPVATGWRGATQVFSMVHGDVVAETPKSEIVALRLDAASPAPQIVFSAFWGGAHCCTVTKIATLGPGGWTVLDGDVLDGSGYGFEDIDGDGVYELISSDNSFLYAFAPYSDSLAPVRLWRCKGDGSSMRREIPALAPTIAAGSRPSSMRRRSTPAAGARTAFWRGGSPPRRLLASLRTPGLGCLSSTTPVPIGR